MKSPMLIRFEIALCALVALGLLLYPVASARAATLESGAGSNATAPPKPEKRKALKKKAAKRKPASPALDLSFRDRPVEEVVNPENPNYASTMLRRKAGGGSAEGAAESAEISYKTEPLFQSEQRLQLLDTEVPVTVKLGRWKTDESKALGLSATVPLPHASK